METPYSINEYLWTQPLHLGCGCISADPSVHAPLVCLSAGEGYAGLTAGAIYSDESH